LMGSVPVIRQGVFYTVLTVPECEQFKTKAGSLNGICRQRSGLRSDAEYVSDPNAAWTLPAYKGTVRDPA
ncbi:hypothetical protein P9D13_03125, partial [Bacillus velezensis]|nr:hypothetical protein [Bacillus velezensis]